MRTKKPKLILDSLLSLSTTISKYCVGMEGNVSGKLDENSFLIKASGQSLSKLNGGGLVTFDFNGNQIDNPDKKGSMELSFHTYLLGFDEVNFVAHTHPRNTLKILCKQSSSMFATERLFPDQVVFNGGQSCLVPYAKPGIELTSLIKERVEFFINSHGYFPKLILLENHGIITCGKTIGECIVATDICEKSAEIFTVNSKFLTPDDIKELVEDKQEKYRQNQLV
jgi:ribulose-5-phosphate 4-epimerase/fuculose-1-phosphate aldolase